MRRRRARRASNPRGHVARRLFRAFALFVRVLAVLLAMQLSGVAHAVHDVVELVVEAGASIENPDCDDSRDSDCPPGSPSCHRAHHNVMPGATSRELLAGLHPCPLGELAGLGYDALAPPRPDPSSLERPPRLLRAS